MKTFCRRRATEYGGKYYWIASQRFASCDLMSCNFCDNQLWVANCELRVFDIASQCIISLSHFELQASKLASHKSAGLWVGIFQIINLEGFESTYIAIYYYSKEHVKFSLPLYSKVFHDAHVLNFRYHHVLTCFLFSLNSFATLTANQGSLNF